eukprot:SAG22_NODE_11279_length_492_cov_1.564885_2_plen_89_part_01
MVGSIVEPICFLGIPIRAWLHLVAEFYQRLCRSPAAFVLLVLLASSFCAALQQFLCYPSAAFLPRPAGFGVIGVIGVTILKIAIACLDR